MTTSVSARVPNPRGLGDQLREELVSAARELLLAPREAAPFSLRAVAKSVGVSPTAVYRHFESAAGLIGAVLEDQNNALRQALAAAGSAADSAIFRDLALRYVRWGLANPGAYQLLFESADRLGHLGGPGAPGWDMIENLAGLLGNALQIDQEASVVLAIRAWSNLHGLTSLRLHKAGMQWPTTIEQEVDAIAESVGVRPDEP